MSQESEQDINLEEYAKKQLEPLGDLKSIDPTILYAMAATLLNERNRRVKDNPAWILDYISTSEARKSIKFMKRVSSLYGLIDFGISRALHFLDFRSEPRYKCGHSIEKASPSEPELLFYQKQSMICDACKPIQKNFTLN
jgi:hypothetical protein